MKAQVRCPCSRLAALRGAAWSLLLLPQAPDDDPHKRHSFAWKADEFVHRISKVAADFTPHHIVRRRHPRRLPPNTAGIE